MRGRKPKARLEGGRKHHYEFSMFELLFDVDNTLYPISREMEDWYHQSAVDYAVEALGLPMAGLAERLEQYYLDYGAVVSGLLRHHPEASAREFYARKGLAPVEFIGRDLAGVNKLRASPRRHIALTNASRQHGEHVIAHLGLGDKFEAVYGLDDLGFHAKPSKQNTRRIIRMANLTPENTVFIEDSLRNLAYPKQLGMKTVLIGDRYIGYGETPDFIDIHVPDLAQAMEAIDAL